MNMVTISVPHKSTRAINRKLILEFDIVSQGGDWGALISKFAALQYGPKHCKAVHFNFMWWVNEPKLLQNPLLWLQYNLRSHTETDKDLLKRRAWFFREGFGYNILQNTKPQTVGYGLHDSPVGLLAWIYEKMRDWSDE